MEEKTDMDKALNKAWVEAMVQRETPMEVGKYRKKIPKQPQCRKCRGVGVCICPKPKEDNTDEG